MPNAAERKRPKGKAVGRKPGTPVDTPALREKFLTVLAESGNVGVAAKECGLYRTTPYQWKKKDAAFSKAWDEALDAAADVVEAEVYRRAVEGVDKPVYYQGEVVGYTKEYSDRMLELLMKALRPEKFRDKQVGDGAILIQINGTEELKALRESNPWGSETIAQDAGQGELSFNKFSVKVEDLQNDRKGFATEAGRQKPSTKGLTAAELYEED